MPWRAFIGITITAFAGCTLSAKAADWNVVRQQNRDYVTFANLAQFYQFPEYTRVSRTVSLRSDRRGIRAQAGTSDLYINGVRFFTDFPLLSNGNDGLISAEDVSKIIEPVLRPNRIHGAQNIETVVLDPGHGGVDQGTANHWGSEKAFALEVALAARDQLRKSGFRVEMTRTNDSGISLEERVDFANRFPHAVFVSIHFNSSDGGAGVESYALAPEGVISNAANEGHASPNEIARCNGNAQDPQNMALTAAVHAAILSRIPAFDRGIRHARFHVLRNIKIPAVLVEGGFLSDPAEAQRIATPLYRQQLASAIALGVQNFNAAVNFHSNGQSFAAAKNSLPPHDHSITEPLAPDEAPPASVPADEPSISINAAD